MTSRYDINLYGMEPAPKGSYKPVNGRSRKTGKRVTRLIPASKNEHPWRQLIVRQIQSDPNMPHVDSDCSVMLDEHYLLLRPKSVKPAKRLQPTVKPDIDKLERAFHDALTDSGIIHDDSQIIQVTATKEYVLDITQTGITATMYWIPNHETK